MVNWETLSIKYLTLGASLTACNVLNFTSKLDFRLIFKSLITGSSVLISSISLSATGGPQSPVTSMKIILV